jgi:hypothetical protein
MQKLFLISTLLLCVLSLDAQIHRKRNYLEAGCLLGATNYSGDISGDLPIVLSETQPGFGVFVRYGFNEKFSFRAHVYSGSISGDDRNSKLLKDRAFRFGTNIVELAGAIEWAPFARESYTSMGVHKVRFTPYLFIGAGTTFANTTAEYYGSLENRETYLKVPFPEPGLPSQFFMVPTGVGLRTNFFEKVIIGGEVGWRPVFSDAIDGIKQNANPNKGDWYYFGGITISFLLSNPERF